MLEYHIKYGWVDSAKGNFEDIFSKQEEYKNEFLDQQVTKGTLAQ